MPLLRYSEAALKAGKSVGMLATVDKLGALSRRLETLSGATTEEHIRTVARWALLDLEHARTTFESERNSIGARLANVSNPDKTTGGILTADSEPGRVMCDSIISRCTIVAKITETRGLELTTVTEEALQSTQIERKMNACLYITSAIFTVSMLSGSYAVAVSSAIFAVCIYLFKQGIKAHNELTNGLSGFLQLEEYTRMFRDAVHTISSNLESISSCIIEIGKG